MAASSTALWSILSRVNILLFINSVNLDSIPPLADSIFLLTAANLSSKSEIQSNKGNLINDPSFDAQVGEYHTDTQGWKKNTNTNNIVKSFDDGVFGNQCLMVRKFGSGATSIYQEIPVSPETAPVAVKAPVDPTVKRAVLEPL